MDSACIIGREHLWLAEWRLHRKWWFGSGVLKGTEHNVGQGQKVCMSYISMEAQGARIL